MGNLRYHGKYVYYHFQDQRHKQQKLSLKLRVDTIRKDPRGNQVFPSEAHELRRKIDRDVFMGVWGLETPDEPVGLRLTDAWHRFIAAYDNTHTVQAYTLAYNAFFEYFDNVDVGAVTDDMLIGWRKSLKLKYPNIKTVEFCIRHMRTFFNYLEEAGLIDRTPVTRRVKMKAVDVPIVIFADKDLDTLFKQLKKRGFIDAYKQMRFLLLTGWRVSDSCNLTRDKIDEKRMVIQHYIGKPGITWEYPMDEEISKFLKALPKDHDPHVFLYRDYHSLGKIFRLIVDDEENNIRNAKKLRVHTLRKQFTYNCFRRGVPLEVCSRLLGHTSVKTTERYYLYWDTQMLRDGLTRSRQATGKSQETSRPRKSA
jgi:integrase